MSSTNFNMFTWMMALISVMIIVAQALEAPTPTPMPLSNYIVPPVKYHVKPIFRPPPTLLRVAKRQDLCEDDQVLCPDGAGCCSTSNPTCCPESNSCCLPDASCCGPSIGCCPSGSVCVDGEMCVAREYYSTILLALEEQSKSKASERSSSDAEYSRSAASYMSEVSASAQAAIASAQDDLHTSAAAVGGALGALLAIALGIVVWLVISTRRAAQQAPQRPISHTPSSYKGVSPPATARDSSFFGPSSAPPNASTYNIPPGPQPQPQGGPVR